MIKVIYLDNGAIELQTPNGSIIVQQEGSLTTVTIETQQVIFGKTLYDDVGKPVSYMLEFAG